MGANKTPQDKLTRNIAKLAVMEANSASRKEEARRWCYEDYAAAMSVFRKGMKQDKDGWLAMNSAVNVLNNANKRLFHDEDSAVTVKIEGLPDIGSPDEE